MIIRPLEAADLAAAVALFGAQLREHDIETAVEDLDAVARQVLADPAQGFILVAAAEGGLCGILYASAHLSMEIGGLIGWIEELYVAPSGRSMGLGTRLLEAGLAHARELGWRSLELEVVAGHERAAALYQRHGFAPLNRVRFSRRLR